MQNNWKRYIGIFIGALIIFSVLAFVLNYFGFFEIDKEGIYTVIWAILILIFLFMGIITISVIYSYLNREENFEKNPRGKRGKAL